MLGAADDVDEGEDEGGDDVVPGSDVGWSPVADPVEEQPESTIASVIKHSATPVRTSWAAAEGMLRC